MALRRRFFLILLTAVALFVAINLATLRLFLMPELMKMDLKEAERDMKRCVGALENKIHRMDLPARKFASLTDIRKHLENPVGIFQPPCHLAAITEGSTVDLVLLIDKEGKILWEKAVEAEGEKNMKRKPLFPHPAELSLQPNAANGVTTGVMISESGPLLTVSMPVFGRKMDGELVGWVVAARFTDEEFIKEIAGETGLSLIFIPAVDRPLSQDAAEALSQISEKKPFFLSPGGEKNLHGYASLPGIGGGPGLLLLAKIPGRIASMANDAIKTPIPALVCSALLLVIGVLHFLKRDVCLPLGELLRFVASPGNLPGHLSGDPIIARRDEIGRLAAGIGRMAGDFRAECEDLKMRLRARKQKIQEINHRLSKELKAREQMEESLRSSENRFKRFMDNSSTVAFIKDQEGRYTWLNRTFKAFFGVTAGSWIGKTDFDVWPEKIAKTHRQSDQTVLSTDRHLEFLTTLPHKGEPTHWIALKFPFTDAKGNRCVGGMAMNITDLKKSETALKESEERFRTLFEESPVALWEEDFSRVKEYLEGLSAKGIEDFGAHFDSNPRDLAFCAGLLSIISVNRAAVRLFDAESKEELLANMRKILGKQSLPMFKQEILTLSSGGKAPVEGSTATLKGREISISLKLSIPGEHGNTWSRVFVSIHDMTGILREKKEKANLEKALQHAQKMQAIGTLAGGIAHNFNNLLMGIQGNISLAMAKGGSEDRCLGELRTIEKLVQSGSDLTKQLLGFAKGERTATSAANLNEILKRSSKMFGQTRKAITIHLDLPSEIWPVEADTGQIEHVLLNLYLNADYAMEGRGSLFLATSNSTLVKEVADAFEVKAGRYVEISVRDTGAGMDGETLEKIFEPFFTTRKMGRGTGLGLASSYGIIRIHGGIITAESTPKQGSTFRIYLPASEHLIPRKKDKTVPLVRGRETVLLVDDELDVLKVTAQMLENSGYRVIKAGSAKAALSLYRDNMEKVDLAIIDMVMPDMDGGELYDHLAAMNPGLKAILASGYGLDRTSEAILERGCSGFIQKPFDMAELSHKVRKILDSD